MIYCDSVSIGHYPIQGFKNFFFSPEVSKYESDTPPALQRKLGITRTPLSNRTLFASGIVESFTNSAIILQLIVFKTA